MLQCVAAPHVEIYSLLARLGVLRCAAVCCSTTRRNLQSTATPRAESHVYNTLPHAATRCKTLQDAATRCNTLQHIVINCDTLQHTATHCNTCRRIPRDMKCEISCHLQCRISCDIQCTRCAKNKITTPPFTSRQPFVSRPPSPYT